MDSTTSQLGWTEAQWNRVREEVLTEWQRVRVAGSFLPVYGPLPPSTQVVPSEAIKPGGDVDDADTSRILELYAPVKLSRQLVSEEDLAGAVLQFRRAATALALHEDNVLFNGQNETSDGKRPSIANMEKFPAVYSKNPELNPTLDLALTWAMAPSETRSGARAAYLSIPVNVGPLGLIGGASADVEIRYEDSELNGDVLVTAIAEAVTTLEGNGYGKPFVCVLGQAAYIAAHKPEERSLVLPSDRIEPLLGRQLLRAKAIDDGGSNTLGIVASLAGQAIDLAVAAEATPEFTHVGDSGEYWFRVFERMALRIKDNTAIVRLERAQPTENAGTRRTGARA